jgi:hypothetical protein
MSNHGVESYALFRAFLSQALFEAGANYVAEFEVRWIANVSEPVWSEAYAALIAQEGFVATEI